MVKRSKIVRSNDTDRLTKSLMDLVTGNPIIEEPSPIKKYKDPLAVQPRKIDWPRFPSPKSERAA